MNILFKFTPYIINVLSNKLRADNIQSPKTREYIVQIHTIYYQCTIKQIVLENIQIPMINN